VDFARDTIPDSSALIGLEYLDRVSGCNLAPAWILNSSLWTEPVEMIFPVGVWSTSSFLLVWTYLGCGGESNGGKLELVLGRWFCASQLASGRYLGSHRMTQRFPRSQVS
jgi:hypothetical protein